MQANLHLDQADRTDPSSKWGSPDSLPEKRESGKNRRPAGKAEIEAGKKARLTRLTYLSLLSLTLKGREEFNGRLRLYANNVIIGEFIKSQSSRAHGEPRKRLRRSPGKELLSETLTKRKHGILADKSLLNLWGQSWRWVANISWGFLPDKHRQGIAGPSHVGIAVFHRHPAQ